MACTVGMYKKNLSHSKINFQNVISTLQEKIDSAIQEMEKGQKHLQTFCQIDKKESSK